MTFEAAWKDAPDFKMPLSDEYLFFDREQVNATAIDPETGARLGSIAQTVGAEIRRTTNDQLAIVSKAGQTLEQEMGRDNFCEMMQHIDGAITDLVNRLFPLDLLQKYRANEPGSFEEIKQHLKRVMKEAEQGYPILGGTLRMLAIGGQSMAVRITCDVVGQAQPLELVAKTTSPLALSGLFQKSIPIISPMTSELLRREIILQDPDFQADAEQFGFELSGGYVATPHFMLEKYYVGAEPNADVPEDGTKIYRYATAAVRVMTEHVSEKPDSDAGRLMSGIDRLDIRRFDPSKPPELRPIKTNNFIRTEDGHIVCIDPFVPNELPPRTNQQTPPSHETLGWHPHDVSGGDDDDTIPFTPESRIVTVPGSRSADDVTVPSSRHL